MGGVTSVLGRFQALSSQPGELKGQVLGSGRCPSSKRKGLGKTAQSQPLTFTCAYVGGCTHKSAVHVSTLTSKLGRVAPVKSVKNGYEEERKGKRGMRAWMNTPRHNQSMVRPGASAVS